MQISLRCVLAAAACGLSIPHVASAARLPDSALPFSSTTQIVAAADPASIVHLQIALRLRNTDALEASNRAHRVLTPAQLNARHLPLQADHDSVVRWLQSEGLQIERIVPSRMTISASGTAAQAGRVFGVRFFRVIDAGQSFTSSDDVPSLPDALGAIVLSINGLHADLHARPAHVLGQRGLATRTASAVPGTVPYIPVDLLHAYGAGALGNGAGSTTAVVIDTFPHRADLTSFWSQAGVAQSQANIAFIQAVAGTLPPIAGEESIDTEYASSMGAASKVRVYAAQSYYNTALDTAFQRVITDLQNGVVITQVSISIVECETTIPAGEAFTDNQYFATMTSLGASVFAATGDLGSHECGGSANMASFFSTSPHVAATGGTTLLMNGAKVTSETGWSGSGGGISTLFGHPPYQQGLGYDRRAVPDLSAVGDPGTGVLVVVNGENAEYGGTSVGTPVLAGLFGLVNANRRQAGRAAFGLVNNLVYPLLGSPDLRDITIGNNGGYSAAVGYDLVTGLGAPLLGRLAGQ